MCVWYTHHHISSLTVPKGTIDLSVYLQKIVARSYLLDVFNPKTVLGFCFFFENLVIVASRKLPQSVTLAIG